MDIILAVSGGIDSMVMLDTIYQVNAYSSHDMAVAHFDHSTRPSSKDDAAFVANVAKNKYHLQIKLAEANLGDNVSEEIARERRYTFLRTTASKFNSHDYTPKIFTAHHLDDLIESVVINLFRGTGWRGLAVLDSAGVIRPFLTPEIINKDEPLDKKAVLKYAAEHNITFRQDPTNYEDKYLRNRVRQKLANFPDMKKQELYELWQKQKNLKHEIDNLVAELVPLPGSPWQRSWFEDLDENIALELLRAGTIQAGISATRPQLLDFLEAIRTYAPGKYFNLPEDRLVKLNKTNFVL